MPTCQGSARASEILLPEIKQLSDFRQSEHTHFIC